MHYLIIINKILNSNKKANIIEGISENGILNFEELEKRAIIFSLAMLLLSTTITLLISRGFSEFISNFIIGTILSAIPYLLTISWINNYISTLEKRYIVFLKELYEVINSGLSFIDAINILSQKYYKELSPYLKKLNVWVSWSIPFPRAFSMFSKLLERSPFINKANSILLESYNIGGDIKNIIKTLSEDLYLIKKLEEERNSALKGQAFTMGFIFFILIVVVLVLKGVLIPIISQMKTVNSEALQILGVSYFKSLFSGLLLSQAIIIGVIIGVILKGSIKDGLKASAILFSIALLINLLLISPTEINVNILPYDTVANPGDPISFQVGATVDGSPYNGKLIIYLINPEGEVVHKEEYAISDGVYEGEIKIPADYNYDYIYIEPEIEYGGDFHKGEKVRIDIYT